MRASHTELETGLEQNIYADKDVFAFVRAPDGAGCSTDHSTERSLIVMNKAQQRRLILLPVDETALAGCSEFRAAKLTPAAAPALVDGKLQIEEPAESITVFEVR